MGAEIFPRQSRDPGQEKRSRVKRADYLGSCGGVNGLGGTSPWAAGVDPSAEEKGSPWVTYPLAPRRKMGLLVTRLLAEYEH